MKTPFNRGSIAQVLIFALLIIIAAGPVVKGDAPVTGTKSHPAISTVPVNNSTAKVNVSTGSNEALSPTGRKNIPFVIGSPLPFHEGELLTFDIQYEFVSGGTATLEVHDGGEFLGTSVLKLISRAKSSKFVDAFFKVRDSNQSLIDRRNLASVNFVQSIREGHFRVERNSTQDYKKGTWEYLRTAKGKTDVQKGVLTENVADILSAFYMVRAFNIELGGEYEIKVLSNGEFYPLRVVVGSKFEKIKVAAGSFECFRVQPFIQGDGIFKARDGNMVLWLTHDEFKMPVLLRSKVSVGAFDAKLVSFVRPTH